MDLIVDGYNVIGFEEGLGGVLELKRNRLLQRLSAYQKSKRINVTVVFDGWRSGADKETVQQRDGVSVVYSRLDEKADNVIIRQSKAKAGGTVVISSDREIRNAVERFGAVAVSSDEFSRILRAQEVGYEDADEEGADEFDQGGRAKRGSKVERRRREVLKKLRV